MYCSLSPLVRTCLLLLPLLGQAFDLHAVELDEAELRSELSKLSSSESDVRKAAIETVAASRNSDATRVLEAYRLGTLCLWNDQLVLTKASNDHPGSLTVRDALTEEPITADGEPVTVSKGDFKSLAASRKERRFLVNAIRVLELYSPRQATRLAATKKLGDLRDPAYIDSLQAVIETENNPKVLHRAKESVALIRLSNQANSMDVRRQAAVELGTLRSANAVPLLEKILQEVETSSDSEPKLDAATRAACVASLEQIEKYQGRVRMLSYIFSGISLGSVLILMALGLSIVFGQMGVINMAHGELMMIGAYATYVTQLKFGHTPEAPNNWFFVAALPISFLVAFCAGLLIEYLVVRHLYKRPLESLLATWGVGLVLIQFVRAGLPWSTSKLEWIGKLPGWLRWSGFGDNIGVNSPTWLVGGFEVIQDFHVSYNRLFIITLTIACVVFVYWLMNCTKRGLLVRATVQNREIAAALGVNTRYEDGFTFAFGAGLAGIAGCALTLIGGVTPDMGQNYIVDSFLVVVTGGVGELAGAVWAGLSLGVLNKILEPIFSTIWAKVLILALVVAFIQYRPAGLFPPKGRLADV